MSCSPFLELDKIPIKFNCYVPKPSYYNKTVFISTGFNEYCCDAGIYEYDIELNKINLIHKYNHDTNIKLHCHGQFIDKQNNLMHIFGGNDHGYLCLDLSTKKILNNNTKSNRLSIIGDFSVCCYISNPKINQFCIMDEHGMYKYMNDKNKVIFTNESISTSTFNIPWPKVIYIPFKKELMILGGNYNDKIYYTDINMQNYDWKPYSLKMPFTTWYRSYDILSAFKSLIFVFNFDCLNRHKDIWILDIMNTKWYKSPYQMPQTLILNANIFVLHGKDNSVYLLEFGEAHRYKVFLKDLIPNSLKTVYKNYYQPLVIGYIKQNENEFIIPNIWRYFSPLL